MFSDKVFFSLSWKVLNYVQWPQTQHLTHKTIQSSTQCKQIIRNSPRASWHTCLPKRFIRTSDTTPKSHLNGITVADVGFWWSFSPHCRLYLSSPWFMSPQSGMLNSRCPHSHSNLTPSIKVVWIFQLFFIGSSPYSINTTFGYARTLAFRVRFHARKNACGVGPRCNINLSLNLECKCLSRSFFPLIYFIIIYQIKLNINVTLTNFGECRTSKENLGLPPTSLPPKKNL